MTTAVCSFLVSCAFLINAAPVKVVSSRPRKPVERDARVIWEQAIEAKAGRERLGDVSNLLESYADRTSIGLYVFPSKLWVWTDDRPTPLGLYLEMINLDRDLSYFAEEGSGPPVNRGKYEARSRGQQPLVDMQLYYLLETQWVKPIPVNLYTGKVGDHSADIVQTIVNGYRVDFHLDKQTHLPLKVAFPSKNSVGTKYGLGTYYTTFSDYAAVSGVQMPRKIGYDTDKPDIRLKVEVNVDYDPTLFERPPSLKDGSDAWRPKKDRK